MRNNLLVSLAAAVGLAGLHAAPALAQNRGTTPGTFTTADGAQIAYTTTGASGSYIVLIHGYPLNGNLFEKQRAALGASYRVLAVDLRGFGLSTAPDASGSIDLYANDVLALLKSLGIQTAVVGGHSMGGAIALRMYQLNPTLFTGLILNDAAAFPPPVSEQFTWRGYQQMAPMGAVSVVPLLLPQFLTGRTRNTRPALTDRVGAQIAAASVNGLVGGARALETRPDFRGSFAGITVPTLILEGEEDPLTPMEQAKALSFALPKPTLAIIPGTSHGVIREASGTANKIILQWLSANNLK